MFSVNALLYGSHYRLAQRLINSFRYYFDWSLVGDVRFGLNEACEETRKLVFEFCEEAKTPWYVYEPSHNVGKYPLMRRMFHDKDRPIRADHVVWFDDDSCLRASDTLSRLARTMEGCVMAGQVWNIPIQGNQWEFVQNQAWFAGKPKVKKFKFIQGGFWAIKTGILQQWQWPPRELKHNGGDSLLGELCRQQDYKLTDFRYGSWVNADDTGKNSSAKRRGNLNKRALGTDYDPMQPVDYSHLNFECKVYYGV